MLPSGNNGTLECRATVNKGEDIMSQYVETPTKSFSCSGALAAYLRVKTPNSLALADATDVELGTMEEAALAANDIRAVRLRTAQGTCKMVAAGAITLGATVYGAASGTIDDIDNNNKIGIALEAATAAGDVIEVLRDCSPPTGIAAAMGVGITGAADNVVSAVEKVGSMYKTTIIIDIDGLNCGGSAGDIIGADGAGVAHLGQITAANNGTIFAGSMTCLELPTGGDPDIDLYSAAEATGVEDTAISALDETKLVDSGDLVAGTELPLTAFPAANEYLYLVCGTATDATYTAGIVKIELWGK